MDLHFQVSASPGFPSNIGRCLRCWNAPRRLCRILRIIFWRTSSSPANFPGPVFCNPARCTPSRWPQCGEPGAWSRCSRRFHRNRSLPIPPLSITRLRNTFLRSIRAAKVPLPFAGPIPKSRRRRLSLYRKRPTTVRKPSLRLPQSACSAPLLCPIWLHCPNGTILACRSAPLP